MTSNSTLHLRDLGGRLAPLLARCIVAPALLLSLCTGVFAAPIILDFSTDDFGTSLVNGQSISTFPDVQVGDTVFEFGNFVNVSTRLIGSDGHEGAAIFNSNNPGPNVGGPDPDLLVNLGNILILQNDDNPSTTLDVTNGLVFDVPNDEKSTDDTGAIVFDFISPIELLSIDMVDFNGGANGVLTLTDENNNERVYNVPQMWTTDVSVSGDGWETLDLTTLLPQPADGAGGDATVIQNDPGFNPLAVKQLDVAIQGNPSSGGIDNLTFTPEPSSWILAALAFLSLPFLARRLRR